MPAVTSTVRGLSASLPIIVVVLLLAPVVQQEIVGATAPGLTRQLSRGLDFGIVPSPMALVQMPGHSIMEAFHYPRKRPPATCGKTLAPRSTSGQILP